MTAPELPPPAAIIWDWDNTLVDGWAAIAGGLNAAFAAFGLPLWTTEEVRGRVRRSLRESFPEMFGAVLRLALAACGVPVGPAVWYVGDTALDMQAARTAGCAAVLVGDAEHDGGVANAMPDACFADGHALASHLGRLAKTPFPAGS